MLPFFTTNPSDFTALEGLYINEQPAPAIVRGTTLNAVGIVGETLRGPVGKVVQIGSEARFREVFGTRDRSGSGTQPLANKVWQALLNKRMGPQLYITRAAASAAVAASFTLETAAGGAGTTVCRIDAANVGAWGNDVGISVVAASNAVSTSFDLLVKYLGVTYRVQNISFNSTDDNAAIQVAKVWDTDAALITITKLNPGRPNNSVASTDGADTLGFCLLGATVAAFTSVAGSDGSIADTDFTATGKGIDLLAGAPGVAIVMVAERMNSTIRAKLKTVTASVTDRIFLMGADNETVAVSATAADISAAKSDRLVYCFNHAYTIDPETSQEIVCRPEAWAASILSQTDVDIHIGDIDNAKYASGITRLYNEALTRADYITLHDNGMVGFEKDDGNFVFVSGRCTDTTELTLRRQKDYLIKAMAAFLKPSVKKKNTSTRRAANAGALRAFLGDLKREERMVDDYLVDAEKLNTAANRTLGLEKMLVRIKIIGHALYLVLVPEIGTSVVITEQVA